MNLSSGACYLDMNKQQKLWANLLVPSMFVVVGLHCSLASYEPVPMFVSSLRHKKGLKCWANMCCIVSFLQHIWKWIGLRNCSCSNHPLFQDLISLQCMMQQLNSLPRAPPYLTSWKICKICPSIAQKCFYRHSGSAQSVVKCSLALPSINGFWICLQKPW